MTKIGAALEKYKEGDEEAKGDMEDGAYDLAHVIRTEIESAWSSEATPKSKGRKRRSAKKKPPSRRARLSYDNL